MLAGPAVGSQKSVFVSPIVQKYRKEMFSGNVGGPISKKACSHRRLPRSWLKHNLTHLI
jgi:hypothetical protein